MSHGETDHARQTGPALEAMDRFMLWLVPTVEKFPRSQKFLLGDRIQGTALDVSELLIEARPQCLAEKVFRNRIYTSCCLVWTATRCPSQSGTARPTGWRARLRR